MSTSTTTTQKTDTVFVKVSREQFDQVIAGGSPEFANQLSTLSSEQIKILEQRVAEIRSQKTTNTYLVFPVRQEKQINAGKLYLKSLATFASAIRSEVAKRTVSSMLASTTAEAVAA
jgi:CRP-like cAMP-binding protein